MRLANITSTFVQGPSEGEFVRIVLPVQFTLISFKFIAKTTQILKKVLFYDYLTTFVSNYSVLLLAEVNFGNKISPDLV